MSLWRIFATVAGVALAARAAHLAIIWNHPLWVLGEFWSKSDMQQFIAWGNHLASGDWLDRETFRPYFDWQRSIAPPEVWNSWFGAHVYYQPPLYAYLLASVLAVTGSLDLFRVGQLVLGAVNCGLIAVLGTRLFNRTAGWVAGLAAACYAPFIFTDAEILRGTLTLATQLLVLLAMVSWHRAEPPGERRLWLVLIGGAFGVAYLADPAMVVFIPFALGWLLVAQRARGKAPAGPARLLARPALVMAGAMAALAPLVARNLAVGAPPLSCTTRGPLAFVMGNAPDAMPAGATIPASTGRILRRSGYAMLPTIRETLRLYAGHYGPLLRQQWFKLRALWSAYEIPDNTSFYYAARVSPVVRYGLRFSVVASLGLIGLVLALPGVLADPRRLLPVLYLLSSEVLFVLAHVVSRYRRPMVLALLLFAGYAVAWLAGRRWQARASIVAAVLAVWFLLPSSPPPGYGYDRPAEFLIAARVYARRGEVDRALRELDLSMRLARDEPAYRSSLTVLLYEKGTIQAAAGRYLEAADSFRAVLRRDPGYSEAAEALRNLPGSHPEEP